MDDCDGVQVSADEVSRKEFIWPIRVYYEDTDAGGVVYHSNYLNFIERARTEWLRSLGYEQDDLMKRGLVFAVRHVDIDYLRPARFNDSLEVVSTMLKVSGTSVTFEQCVMKLTETICRASVTVVLLDASRFRPTAIPADMKEDFLSVC